jgi:small-conductance mechanosensitive channel
LQLDKLWQSAESGGVVTAAGVLGAFLLMMLVIRLVWVRALGPLVRRTDTELDDILLVPLRGLAVWGMLLLGLYYSLSSLEYVQQAPRVMPLLAKALSIGWIVVAIWTSLRVFNSIVRWYAGWSLRRPEGARDISHEASLLRKATNVVVLAIGLLYVLRVAGADISPLLAGGAVGGLAIALALQDTLANLFAGFSMAIDKSVSVGDFIKLESSEEGFVEAIGWRNTRVRLWANNVVVIPNSKLSQSVITNYFLPMQEMSVYVPCGVAYGSDLDRVERVTVEVARRVMGEVEGAATGWEPVVRWKDFGDFAITFVTVLRVRDFAAQYALRSEFVKALHRRFQQEGIEIPFPIRTVIMRPASESPATGGSVGGDTGKGHPAASSPLGG